MKLLKEVLMVQVCLMLSLTSSTGLPAASVELVKVDLEGKDFSCFEAVIGGNGVQVSCETAEDEEDI